MNIACFLYHRVTNNIINSYTHSTEMFNQHVNIFKSRMQISSIYQVSENQKQWLLVSTDDGYVSDLYVADKLEALGSKGHFFIITSLIGTRGYLTIHQIRDLYQRGHIIGSHTHTHTTPFTKLSYLDMKKEWNVSKNSLQSWIGDEIICGSIPGGARNVNVECSAFEQGIKFLFTSEPKLDPWWYKNMMCIGRICPKRNTSLQRINHLSMFQGFKQEQLFRYLKVLGRKILRKE